MKKAKNKSTKQVTAEAQTAVPENGAEITNRAELSAFLLTIRDSMDEEAAPPIFARSALYYVMNLSGIHQWLDN